MRDAIQPFGKLAVVLVVLLLIAAPVAGAVAIDFTVEWQKTTNSQSEIYGDTHPTDGVYYIGSDESQNVTAYEANGTKKWEATVAQGVFGIAYGNDSVYVHDGGGTVYQFDETDGSQLASISLSGSDPSDSGDIAYDANRSVVYVASFPELYEVEADLSSQTVLNGSAFPSRVNHMSVSNGSNAIYTNAATDVRKFNKDTGGVEWVVSVGDDSNGLHALDNGSVLVSGGNELAYLDSDGTQLWASATDTNGVSFQDTENAGGIVFLGKDANNVGVRYLTNGSLIDLWTAHDTGNPVKEVSAGAHDGFVFVGSQTNLQAAYTVTNLTAGQPGPPEVTTQLELEINRWQPFNSTQEYTVLVNETNTTTGVSTYTDVSENATVTVYNITNTTGFSNPIVTVNNTSDTLVSYDQTGVVAVNATYDGQTLGNATNLTVGNRNLTNIGIMPPSQWLASFLELDSVSGPHGIGSPTQWVLFIVLIMVGATHLADNGWAGLGGGVLTTILLWILGYVDLGTVLSTVFVVTLLSLALIKARRLRSVNPSGGGGGQP